MDASRAVLATIAAAILSACGTQRMYEGEARPTEAVSLLRTSGLTSGVSFMEVDGKRVNPFQSTSIEVLPGEHTVHIWIQRRHMGDAFHGLFPVVSATVASSYYCAKFHIVAKPGRTYFIRRVGDRLGLATVTGDVAGMIEQLHPVPLGNLWTSTPTDCASQTEQD